MSNSAPFTITMQAAASAPSWFTAMASNTWGSVASVGTVLAVAPGSGEVKGHHRQVDITHGWTGGTIDQVNKRFYMIANGGHNGYYGNEAYRLNLSASVPAWERIWGPSAYADQVTTDEINGSAAYADGTMSATHTYCRGVFAQGKAWFPGVDSMSGDAGRWTTESWSFNPANLGAPWVNHGKIFESPIGEASWKWLGGSGAYDAANNRIWGCAQYSTGKGVGYIDVATGAVTGFPSSAGSPGYGFSFVPSWWASPKLCTVNGVSTYTRYWDIPIPGSLLNGPTWQGSIPAWGAHGGSCYSELHRSVFIWISGQTIYRLRIPDDSVSGTWSWSTITMSGGVTPSAPPEAGTNTRFNVIDDMGNGQTCFVLQNEIAEPCYVFKAVGL